MRRHCLQYEWLSSECKAPGWVLGGGWLTSAPIDQWTLITLLHKGLRWPVWVFLCLFCFETGYCYRAEASLESVVDLLPLFAQCWDYMCVTTSNCLVNFLAGWKFSHPVPLTWHGNLSHLLRQEDRQKIMPLERKTQGVEHPRTWWGIQSLRCWGALNSNSGFNKCRPGAICFPNVDELSSL